MINTASMASETINKNDLNKLIESLKSKVVIYTSSEKVYNELIKLPYMNEKCLILSKLINGTYIVDMEKLKDYMPKPFMFEVL